MVGYNYNLAGNHADDHRRAPSRIMMTTESFPANAFEQWQLTGDNPFIIGEFIWTAMDDLGESGIGAWGYGTPAQAEQAAQPGRSSSALQILADQYFIGMIKGAYARPARG
jgi:beta-galactosidase